MVVELPDFKTDGFRTAKCVKIWSPFVSRFNYLTAVWSISPLDYSLLAYSTSEEELKIWWDMQNIDIPFSNDKLHLTPEDVY